MSKSVIPGTYGSVSNSETGVGQEAAQGPWREHILDIYDINSSPRWEQKLQH